MEHQITITFRLSVSPMAKTSPEDIEECIQAGFIAFRDNSLPIAHVEDYTTGEIHPITIEDFSFGEKMRGE